MKKKRLHRLATGGYAGQVATDTIRF
jgi:hypothetical protein